MIRFLHPEAFLLVPLVVAALWRTARSRPVVAALRVALLVALVAVVADPVAVTARAGRDLVVVVDRSLSVPPTAAATPTEIAERAAREAGDDDRWGVVAFGRTAAVEAVPRAARAGVPPAAPVDGTATDLAAGLDAALATIPSGRDGSLVVISDGEATGGDAEAAARRARRRGIRVDVVPLRRAGVRDVAVEEVLLPPEVATGEPFQVAAWVRSDHAVEATVRLLRDGVVVAEGRRSLATGVERVLFRDVIGTPGVHALAVEVDAGADRVPENDRAMGVVRVEGRFRVLCVTPAGRADRLTRSLVAAGLEVVVSAAPSAPLRADALDGFRAVVLEDVPADDLPPGGMRALAAWVRDHGGGLIMTGGRASFGAGGYHRSVVEDVLPVSLEVREEQRKFSLAMAIALDRSGSMSAPAVGGPTKMDLANLGACAAVDVLTSQDAVAVLAVDSAPHVVVPMTPVRDRRAVQASIRRIESMGGGIFTATALHAAAAELAGARQGTRHIVLFADAADAEEPGDTETFVPALRRAGVTVSVIGLGSTADSDAAFLQRIAHLGGGRAFFASDASDLPRVFAQEAISVSRSALVDQPVALVALPDLVALGALDRGGAPSVGGYSVAYLKAGATRGYVTQDEQRAPFLSWWQHGLGRSAAFLGIADGELSGGLATWDRYGDTFATLVRWVAGSDAADEVFGSAVRRGHDGFIVVEADRDREDLFAAVEARVTLPSGEVRPVALTRTGPTRLEGRFALDGPGIFRPTLGVGAGRFVRIAPLVLPYAAEFAPRVDPTGGETLLRRLAELTGGRVDPPSGTLFDGPRVQRTSTSAAFPFVLAALLVFLLEILVRRTDWSPSLRGIGRRVVGLVRRVRGARPVAGRPVAPDRPGPAPAGPAVEASPEPGDPAPPAPPPVPPSAPRSPPDAPGIADVLDRTRRPRR